MPERWNFYFCNVNGSLASIFLNLGLANEAPIQSKPKLLWVWIHFNSPRTDGLSSSEEAPKLNEIEDAISKQILGSCDALLAGRITTLGRRELYFYAERIGKFEEIARAALAEFADYKFDLGQREDREWKQYLEVLYPSPEDLQRMGNRDVLEALGKHGDVPHIPRTVEHWLFFRDPENRSACRDALVSMGFTLESEYEVEGESPHALAISRIQSIEGTLIDQTSIDLMNLAQRFDGDYDGWEAQATTE